MSSFDLALLTACCAACCALRCALRADSSACRSVSTRAASSDVKSCCWCSARASCGCVAGGGWVAWVAMAALSVYCCASSCIMHCACFTLPACMPRSILAPIAFTVLSVLYVLTLVHYVVSGDSRALNARERRQHVNNTCQQIAGLSNSKRWYLEHKNLALGCCAHVFSQDSSNSDA